MNTTTSPRLGHVAIAVREPRRAAAFYRDLLDLQIVRDGGNQLTGDAILLSGDPVQEDHELVLFTNPAAEHIAFRVETAHDLRALYTRAKQRRVDVPYALDSSVAVGFFVRDPQEHAVEIYLPRSRPGRDRPPLSDPEEIARLILSNEAALP